MVFCDDLYFGGRCEEITEDIPNLANHPLGDKTLSSLAVPHGSTVAVFEHPDYQGQCEAFDSDERDLRTRPIGQNTASSVHLGVSCPPTVSEPSFSEPTLQSLQTDADPGSVAWESHLPKDGEPLATGMRSRLSWRPVAW